MINIVLFGPPGAGKGTQAERLAEHFNLVHLSTGEIFRKNIKGDTELGQLAKSFMNQGALVPDEVTIGMLESEVDSYPEANGFIFDGFPRTTAQAVALDKFMDRKKTAISRMLALEVPEEELKTRLLGRAAVSGRADDADPTIIANRIEVYHRETAPVADFYREQGKYNGIDGMGSIEEITDRLIAAINAN